MPKRRLPELRDTGRRYMDNTVHARLASPGVEKYRPARRGGGGRLALAALAVAALVAAMIWAAR